jgi:hypothetical protein
MVNEEERILEDKWPKDSLMGSEQAIESNS